MIEVVRPGLFTTIQDLGRRGHEQYGMPPSGVFDPFLATIANKLAGNAPTEAVLEFAIMGPTLHFERDCWAATAGYSIQYVLNGREAPQFEAFRVPAGSLLQFRAMTGWFGYLAIGGAFTAPKVLGSCSTYSAGRIGGKLERGDRLKVGEDRAKHFTVRQQLLTLRTTNIVEVLPGLHHENFTDREQARFVGFEYQISPRSNRMGIHLDGNRLQTIAVRRSAPTIPGTIQVPRSGLPIILGPEGPTTGGYPQLAILSRVSWTVLAGLRPGQRIRFQWTDLQQARQQWRFRQQILDTADAWQEIKNP